MKKSIKFVGLLVVITMLFTMVAVGCSQKEEPAKEEPSTSAPAKEDTSKKDDSSKEPAKEAETDISWPEKPIQLIVPAGAGGDTDFNARTAGKYLEKELGQPIVIVNVGGAGGTTGGTKAKNSDPDGYTGVFWHNGMLIAKLLGLVDYSIDGFEEVGVMSIDNACAFIGSADSDLKTMQDVVDKLKAEPKSVSFATEVGSFTHLQVLAFQAATGVEFNIVDVGGSAKKTAALKGGQIDIMGNQYGVVKQYIENGDFICLGYLSDTPIEGIEGKTFKEQGIDVSFTKFFNLAFPKGTDSKIVEKMNKAMQAVAANPDYQKEIGAQFLEPAGWETEKSLNYILDTQDYYAELLEPIINQ